MFLKKLLTLSAFALLWVQLAAQQPHPVSNPGGCGVVGHSKWLDWFRQYRETLPPIHQRGADTTWLYVPVTIHIVGRGNGTGYFRTLDALRAICEMNEQFKPAYIHYYMHPVEPFLYHNNTSWHDHDWSGGAEMIETTLRPDRLNAYVVANPAGNCGYSWLDAIVLGRNCSNAGNSTWAHEAGHHFSLPHPFLGWEGENFQPGAPAPLFVSWGGEVEKLDGSNCYQSGDFFCDTRPDYLSYRWSCDNNRESLVTLTDPNGENFKADGTLYMSYSLDACSNRFSPEQIEAMRTNLLTEHQSYLSVWEAGDLIPDDLNVQLLSPIDTQTAQYNNIKFSWLPVPGADFYTVEVGLTPAFSLILASKTVSNATSLTITTAIPNNRVLAWRVLAHSRWDVCQPNDNVQIGIFKTVNLSATNELERVASFELRPNPVAIGQVAKLMVESSETLDATIRVVDFSGKSIVIKNTRLAFGNNEVEINTDHLEAGMYILQLQTSKGTIVRKLTVIE